MSASPVLAAITSCCKRIVNAIARVVSATEATSRPGGRVMVYRSKLGDRRLGDPTFGDGKVLGIKFNPDEIASALSPVFT